MSKLYHINIDIEIDEDGYVTIFPATARENIDALIQLDHPDKHISYQVGGKKDLSAGTNGMQIGRIDTYSTDNLNLRISDKDIIRALRFSIPKNKSNKITVKVHI